MSTGQGRYLAYCVSCDQCYVVCTNGFGVAIEYENIPDDQQAKAHERRLHTPGSQLYSFGGCEKCGKKGWAKMKLVGFRGIPGTEWI